MSMIGGLPASGNTYQVTVSIDNTQTAASINQMVSGFRSMDANFSAAVSQMRQTMGQLGAQARGQLSEIPNTFAGMGQNAQGAMSSIGRLAASFGVFSTARQLVEGMKDSLTDLRTYTEKMNQDLTNMQLRLAEVQSISGRAGTGGAPVLQEHLELMKYTGMTSEQAMKFTGEFTGEAEIYRPKFTPGDFRRIQQDAARFAMIHGGDTGTHATIAGRLAGYAAPGTGADEIMRQQAEIYRLLNAGAGNTAQLAASFNNALATLVSPTGEGGQVGSARALAGLAVGASRLGAPATVDTTLERFANVMTGQTRSKDWTKFLRGGADEGGLGIKEGTPVESAMGRVFARMERESATGKDLMQWAKDMGISNAAERRTLVGMFNQRFGIQQEMAKPEVTTAEARQVLTDPYTMGRAGFRPELALGRAQAGTRAAQLEQAQQNQLAEIFRARAVTELTRENQIGPQWQAGLDVGQRFDQMITNQVFGQDFKSRQAIDERAAMIYERETRRKLPGHAQFEKEGPTWRNRLFGISDRFVNEDYVMSNQLSADINQAETGRKLGFDAATGRATPDTKLLKDIADGVRKDRPMTVAKPAPSPRP
jgi:hypothetical protein